MPHVLFAAKAHCSLLFSWGSPKTTHPVLWICLLGSEYPGHTTAWAASSIRCKISPLLFLILLRFQSAHFSRLLRSSYQEPCLTVAAHSPHWVLLTNLLGVSHCPLLMAFMKILNNIVQLQIPTTRPYQELSATQALQQDHNALSLVVQSFSALLYH